MKEVDPAKYFWVKGSPMLVDENEVFWAWGTAGSGRYNLFNIFFGLKNPFLKNDRKNTLMGGKSGKKNLVIPKKTILEQQPYGSGKSYRRIGGQ